MENNLTKEQRVIHDECHKCYSELKDLEAQFLDLQEKYNAKKIEYEQLEFQLRQIMLD